MDNKGSCQCGAIAFEFEGPYFLTFCHCKICQKIHGEADFWIMQGDVNTPRIHVAFRAENREMVQAFYAAALEIGGRDNGAPGLRSHYHPNYYGAFVLDPDGHNIEAVCHVAV